MPWHANVGKRLVKTPKLYLRDSGIFHALQAIPDMAALHTNPKAGASWEGFALEELATFLGKRDSEIFFYAAHSGVELDVYWQDNGRQFGADFKYMDAPRSTKSMHQAIEDLQLDHLWVLYPGNRTYPIAHNITAIPLTELARLKQT